MARTNLLTQEMLTLIGTILSVEALKWPHTLGSEPWRADPK